MAIHELKTISTYFDAVAEGRKTFEVRRNDRGFQAGDLLYLIRVTDDYSRRATGERLTRRITYLLQGGQFGIEPGFCVLGLGEVEP